MNKIIQGNALDKLKELESESVDCCITSPPFWALRDYKVKGQIGLESSYQEYISKLVEIFAEVKRVLKKTGSLWVNLGDTYNGNSVNRNGVGKSWLHGNNSGKYLKDKAGMRKAEATIPEKSLCLIPQRFQIAMVDAGWICRNTIIWYKPNCMPSSAKDRFTVDFEYLFFFTRSQRYFFETQYEPLDSVTLKEMEKPYTGQGIKDYEGNGVQNPSDIKRRMISGWQKQREAGKPVLFGGNKAEGYGPRTYSGNEWSPNGLGRIKRCVWKIPTQPFSEAHFAVFPPAIVLTPLLATCPLEGIVLDPFMGSGTVALVAMQNARNFIGIELNQTYIDMAMARLQPYLLQTRLPI